MVVAVIPVNEKITDWNKTTNRLVFNVYQRCSREVAIPLGLVELINESWEKTEKKWG